MNRLTARLDRSLKREFISFVQQGSFPCLGARSAAAHDRITSVIAADIRSSAEDRNIVSALHRFIANATPNDLYISFVAFFPRSSPLNEVEFEQALWHRLQKIHHIDHETFDWDRSVSSNPASLNFSMSIGGNAFYVIGLHPAASRSARRFCCPALVFNLHRQFDILRADRTYERMRRLIIARDVAAHGSANPMLARHGESSEARQYSGRAVGYDWICPFQAEAPPC